MNFYADISLFWLFPVVLICAGATYIYYRKQEVYLSGSKLKKIGLIGLRSLSLFLLFLLLFNILIERKVSRSEKPLFVVLADNSSSMKNYGDSSSVPSQIKKFNQSIEEKFGDRFDIMTFSLSDTLSANPIELNGTQTDLNIGFDYIFNNFYNRNIGGVCLISDGNYNKGIDPIYAVEKLNLTPVFTLGVGDTLLKKDQLIRAVNANSIAFLDNEFPVEISFEAKKLKGRTTKLSILKGGKELMSKDISITEDHFFSTEMVSLKAESVGFHAYEVRLEVFKDEKNIKNNVHRFYVEVIDTRSKVLLLSDAPHPDIAAIRSVLEGDERTEVKSSTIEKFDGDLKEVELVIVHGLQSGKFESIHKSLVEKGIPCWYFYSSTTESGLFQKFLKGGRVPEGKRFDNTNGYTNTSFQLFEFDPSVEEMLKNSPPLYTRFGTYSGNFGDTWIKQRLGQVKKDEPLLSFSSQNGRRCAYMMGEGIWRWKLNEFTKTESNDGFNELIQKTVQYLTVKRNTEPLRVFLPDQFTTEKDIELKAEFYNEALEPITSPDIELTLTSEKGKTFNYRFSKRNSDYQVNLGKHLPGAYSFVVQTTFNGKKYLKKGGFIVSELTVESLTTHSDFGLLRKLSIQSGGKFERLSEANKLIEHISERKDIVNLSYTESKFSDLMDLIMILLILLISLSTEWFIRRYSGSY